MTTIPKHIHPNDWSQDACRHRVEHHAEMVRLNPKGFRQPGKRSHPTRIERLAQRAYGRSA
jgi:hypothetical protein